MVNLVKKIQNNIFQKNLFERGSGLIVGISGGPDSVCLLEILARLQKKYDLKIILAHVNYALRGKDSDKDQKLVEDLAQRYALELFVLRPKVGKKYSEKSLRDVRYDFFEKIRKENYFEYIAVAHTLDDQVETFFMRLIRGAGLSGLTSMKFRSGPASTRGNDRSSTRGGKIIRPLLNISKKEILEFLKKNKIAYRTDRTNMTNKFFRNKIRNILIPLLEKDFNPNVKEMVFANSLSIADDYSLLLDLAQKEYAKIFSKTGVGSVQKILALPESLQRMVLREAIAETKENLQDINAAHTEEILKAIKSSKNKTQRVSFGGLKVVRNDDKLKVS